MDDNTFYEFCRMGPAEASKSLQGQPAMHEAFISKLLFMFCPYGDHEDQRMDIEETATELQGVPFVTWLLWLCTSPKADEAHCPAKYHFVELDHISLCYPKVPRIMNAVGRLYPLGVPAHEA
jgi:hypothetical protein